MGKDRSICLLFISMDGSGTIFEKTVDAGAVAISVTTSGQRYSDTIKKYITLMRGH